jgi:hypothetical protein
MNRRISAIVSGTLMICVALLSGCARSLPALPLSAGARVASKPSAWMSHDASNKNLLYVSSFDSVVVYDYGTDTQVGELDYFTRAAGSCTDARGDVFVTNDNAADVLEFKHGSSAPLKMYIDSSPYPIDCSVDSRTGNLAVVNEYGKTQSSPGDVAIYPAGQSKAKIYRVKGFSTYVSGSFDASGDLLVSGYNSSALAFAILRHGSSEFEGVILPNKERWTRPGYVRWDGEYFDVEFAPGGVPSIFVWYTIEGTQGIEEGYTITEGSADEQYSGPFWLGRVGGPKSVKRANQLVVGTADDGVMGWNYPEGGGAIFDLYEASGAGGVTASIL